MTEIDYDGTTQNVKYAYDELGRVKTRTAENGNAAGKLTSTYGYAGGGYGTNSTTPLVASIAQSSGAGAAMNFAYAYDNRGNITSETRNGAVTTYAYDALGQLTRVNDPHENATWVFNYDRGGNITSKVKYAYTTGTLGTAQQTIPYVYGDANWKDKLTSYNGQAISYDAIGNPLNDGIWSYTWGAGRQLKNMSAEGTAVSFKYDHNGLRTQKVVQQDWYPVTTDYTLHGKLITHMNVHYTDFEEIQHTDALHFFYDAQSRPAFVSFNGAKYAYVLNLQGDVVGLVDSTGALVVEYMRSRLYNASMCRFIGADAVLGAVGKVFSHNTYSYCSCSPVIFEDQDGNLFGISFAVALTAAIVGAAVGFVSQVAANIVTGAEWHEGVIGAAVGGAVYNVVSVYSYGDTALASYASAAAESLTNEVVSYTPLAGKSQKALTKENVSDSLNKVGNDTLINGTAYLVAGRMAEKASPVIARMNLRKRLIRTTLRTAWGRQMAKQTIRQAYYTFNYNIGKQMVPALY